MTPLAYLNGAFIPRDTLAVSYADAGFVFGATVTDFCRTYHGKLFRWPDHLRRFRNDCDICRIPLIPTDAEITDAAERLIAQHSEDVALISFATPGPLGYMTGAGVNGPPTLGMHTFPVPKERYRRFFTDGATLALAGRLTGDLPLTVKHRSRLAWWLANHNVHAEHPMAIPVLLSDQGGAADTAIGAVLAVIDGCVTHAPPGTVLDSISLRVVQQLCKESGIRCEPRCVDWENPHMEPISEVMIAGSAFGIAGVRTILHDGVWRRYEWPGPVTRQLIGAWSNLTGVEIGEESEPPG